MYYGQHVHGCVFNQIEKVTEYYQANASLPTVFENNLMTNIDGNILVINGATTNAVPPSYTICNNTFYGTADADDILFTPAENVTISSNVFHGPAEGISFSAAGLQPANGSAAVMSNFVIVANSFNDTFVPIVTDGYPVEDVVVSNNTSAGTYSFAMGGGGWKTNWLFANNLAPATINSTAVVAGQYFTDQPSDHLGWYDYNDYTGVTNYINYGNGCRHLILHEMASSVFQIVTNDFVPAGAVLEISNTTASAISLSPTLSLQAGQETALSWNGSSWQAQAGPPPLNYTIVPSAGEMILAWPTNALGYTLQCATNLVGAPVWYPAPFTPAIINGQNVVTSSFSAPQMFFRISTNSVSSASTSPSFFQLVPDPPSVSQSFFQLVPN
jgi:hypothetical protein